jgi:RTX calcium-binding nonapeptide repeat (4 copies)
VGHVGRAAAACAVVAGVFVAFAAAASPTSVDGRVTLDRSGEPPVAGTAFRVVANVDSVADNQPFDFTLRATASDGLEIVEWSNPFMPVNCERAGQTVTCRSRTIGGVATNINFTLRAASAGSYLLSAVLTVETAADFNPANNSTALELEVRPAPASSPTAGPKGGTSGPDNLRGTNGADRLLGRGGADVLRGLAGNDHLDGGAGNDRLYGDGGNDTLVGGLGNDLLVGGPGANRYAAGAGNDTVRAANGRGETVSCGAGRDAAVLDRADRPAGCERITRR